MLLIAIEVAIAVTVLCFTIIRQASKFPDQKDRLFGATVKKLLVWVTVLFMLFSVGCRSGKDDLTAHNINMLPASPDLEEINREITEAGFCHQENSTTFKGTGEKTKFKLSKYKKDNFYYLLLEFSCVENTAACPVVVQVDNTETTRPQAVYSAGLSPQSECFYFSPLGPVSSSFCFLASHEGLDRQWVVFYMEAKEEYSGGETIHGECLLEIEGEHWSGAF